MEQLVIGDETCWAPLVGSLGHLGEVWVHHLHAATLGRRDLSLFQGDTGPTGPQGPQGLRGLPVSFPLRPICSVLWQACYHGDIWLVHPGTALCVIEK